MIPIRYLLTSGLLLLAFFGVAEAQVVINDLPFAAGSGPYVQYNTDNEDGTNTAAINALIGQSGANQTYDMTTVVYEDTFTGEYAIFDGAVGPGADIEQLDQATKTLALPFNLEEDGNVYEGVIYDYVRATADTSYNLGGFFEGTFNGGPIEFTTVRTPLGDPEFVFPMSFGSTWSGEFTETTMFGGSTFSSDFTKDYEVDGWGTMIVPTIQDPIEVLRVKSIQRQMIGGFEFSTTCYDLRANGSVAATFCEGEFDKEPTAFVTLLNTSTTDAESAPVASKPFLEAAYPNPARRTTTLRYHLPRAEAVTLTVFDVLGRAVLNVLDEVQQAGVHEVAAEVQSLTPGMYFVRLQAGREEQTQPLTVVR